MAAEPKPRAVPKTASAEEMVAEALKVTTCGLADWWGNSTTLKCWWKATRFPQFFSSDTTRSFVLALYRSWRQAGLGMTLHRQPSLLQLRPIMQQVGHWAGSWS